MKAGTKQSGQPWKQSSAAQQEGKTKRRAKVKKSSSYEHRAPLETTLYLP